MSAVHEKLYRSVLSVFYQWEFLILRMQVLLLWERAYMSLAFNIFVQLVFWTVALARQNSLFIICVSLSVCVLCDLFRNTISRFIVGPSESPGSFTSLVSIALREGHILSVEELSLWIANILHYIVSLVNGLAPCRRRRPLLFFVITSGISIVCIWLGAYLPGLAISYVLLNICLIVPVLLHYHVGSRLWHTMRPILRRIEEEFDRHQLESLDERLASEAEFYQPIIAAAAASHPELLSDENDEGFLSDDFLYPSSRRRTSSSDELDSSEAAFVKQFAPKMSNTEIDRLFSDVLTDAGARAATSSFSPSPTVAASDANFTTMFDEYATDDDEVGEYLNHTEDNFNAPVCVPEPEHYLDDFLMPKKEEAQ